MTLFDFLPEELVAQIIEPNPAPERTQADRDFSRILTEIRSLGAAADRLALELEGEANGRICEAEERVARLVHDYYHPTARRYLDDNDEISRLEATNRSMRTLMRGLVALALCMDREFSLGVPEEM